MLTVYIVVGAVGLVLILLSLIVGEVLDVGDGIVSGTAMGAGLIVFGASGALVTTRGLAAPLVAVGSLALAALAVFLIQRLLKYLQNTEDGVPRTVIGVHGVATTDIDTDHGEVSLEDVQELERRLAWSEELIPAGSRVIVVEQSGSKVRVQQHFSADE